MKKYQLLILLALIMIACQKLNLQKDGYFVFKTSHSKTVYDKCEFLSDSIPGNRANFIYAGARVVTGDSMRVNDYPVSIIYVGNPTGTYNTNNSSTLGELMAFITVDNNRYEYPINNFNTMKLQGQFEVVVEKHDLKKGKLKGHFSGKLCNAQGDYIEVDESDFVAMERNK